MKIFAFLFCCMALSWPLLAHQDDLALLGELIEVTQSNLEEQKQLLSLMKRYEKTRDAFVGDWTSQKLAALLMREASLILKEVEKHHLAHLFSSEFMTEIRFFTEVREKAKAP
ncbi:MAG: hypothetical protein K1000chlam4_00245 [Chlamydiae bacterium]|nr:hypothetical protein [Chlamydiota bacterium]